GEQFKILDPATPPVRPTGIQRLRVNGGGIAFGLVLGLAIAALLEFRDKTFRSTEDVLGVLKLPVLALVPELIGALERRRARRRTMVLSAASACAVITAAYGAWALQLWKYVK